MERTIDAYLRPGWAGDTQTAEAVAQLVAKPRCDVVFEDDPN